MNDLHLWNGQWLTDSERLKSIREQLENKIVETVQLIQDRSGKTIPVPSLNFRQMGKRAGLATHGKNSITINPDFCLNGHWNDMLNQTLPHEVAHLAAFHIYGINEWGHGKGWKCIMQLIGLEPHRCHSYSTDGVKKRNIQRIEYLCNCKTHMVSMTLHKRILMGRKYTCRCCKSRIEILDND